MKNQCPIGLKKQLVVVAIFVVTAVFTFVLYKNRVALQATALHVNFTDVYATRYRILKADIHSSNLFLTFFDNQAKVIQKKEILLSNIPQNGRNFDIFDSQINLSYVPRQVYSENGNNSANGVVEILADTVRSSEGIPLDDWSLWGGAINLSNKPTDRLNALADFAKLVSNHIGIPNDETNHWEPNYALQQLRRGGKSLFWCVNLAPMLVVDLHERSILSRVDQVYSYIPGSARMYEGGHTFTELYLTDLNKWALVDPTLGIYSVVHRARGPLSAWEFSMALNLASNNEAIRLLFFDDNNQMFVWKNLKDISPGLLKTLNQYYNVRNTYYYHTGESPIYGSLPFQKRILNYFTFSSSQYIVNGAMNGNLFFYLLRGAMIFLMAEILVLALLCYQHINRTSMNANFLT